jgi:cytochrome c
MRGVDLFSHCRYTQPVILPGSYTGRVGSVRYRAVSLFQVAAAASLVFSGQVFAESRADVLERIKPIGMVSVEGQAMPAPAPVAESAPAAAAPASEPASVQTAAAPSAAGGAELYKSKTCFSCHGADANSPIMPVYPRLAGQNAVYLTNQMRDIKSGARNHGQTMVMKGIMANVSDEEIQAIAEWLAIL